MSVSVVIPWRDSGDEQRKTSLTWILDRLRDLFPLWEIVLASDGHGARDLWSASTARNHGVALSSGDVIVLLDADTWVSVERLLHAVRMVERSLSKGDAGDYWPWVQPHSNILRLSAKQSADYQATGRASYEQSGGISLDDLAAFEQTPYHQFPGCVPTVIARELYEACPQDPRIEGWVPEDICWGFAMTMLHSSMYRLEGNAVHFWHTPDPMRQQRQDGKRLDQVEGATPAFWASHEVRFRYHNIHGKYATAQVNGDEIGLHEALEEMRALVGEYQGAIAQ